MHRTTVRAIALLAFLGGPLPSSPAFAQATPTEPAPSSSSPGTPPASSAPAPAAPSVSTPPPAAAPTPPPAAAAPTPAPPVASAPAAPMLPAKGLDGMDVFSSDGQQVGKVVKVNVIAEGKMKDVEVHSSGFLASSRALTFYRLTNSP